MMKKYDENRCKNTKTKRLVVPISFVHLCHFFVIYKCVSLSLFYMNVSKCIAQNCTKLR